MSAAPMTRGAVRYALVLLLIINILNFVDRQIVSILIEPIKRDLGLADWQLGMITGLAFALFYTVLGIPVARLVERGDRPRIMAACIAIWSAFTAVCGLAQNFGHLMLARIGVGIGEAGCTPAAHSLIGDYTPPDRRASAIAIFAMGTPLGSVLGLTLGGFLASAFGWRATFIIVGLPGLAIALLAWGTLREPRRAAIVPEHQTRESWATAWRDFRKLPAFWLLALGVALTGIVGYGGGSFLPSFFFRNHADELQQLADGFGLSMLSFFGLALGVAVGVAGVIGTWLGGRLADRFGTRDMRAYAVVPAIAALFAFPLYAAAVLVPSALWAIVLIALANIAITIWPGPVFAGIHMLVQPHQRATASAMTLLLVNLIGLGIGPLAVGAMSDGFAAAGMGEAAGIRWAQVAVTGAGFASILAFLAAARAMRR